MAGDALHVLAHGQDGDDDRLQTKTMPDYCITCVRVPTTSSAVAAAEAPGDLRQKGYLMYTGKKRGNRAMIP